MSNIGFGWLSFTNNINSVVILPSNTAGFHCFQLNFLVIHFKHTEKENKRKSGKTFQTVSIITPTLVHAAVSL